jgi:hypothetical protein
MDVSAHAGALHCSSSDIEPDRSERRVIDGCQGAAKSFLLEVVTLGCHFAQLSGEVAHKHLHVTAGQVMSGLLNVQMVAKETSDFHKEMRPRKRNRFLSQGDATPQKKHITFTRRCDPAKHTPYLTGMVIQPVSPTRLHSTLENLGAYVTTLGL